MLQNPEPKYGLAHRVVELGKIVYPFTIRQAADLHLEDPAFDKEMFAEFVNTQKDDKRSLWIDTGDGQTNDRGSTRERRAQVYLGRKSVSQADDKAFKRDIDAEILPYYDKIKDSCLGLLAGDHYKTFTDGTNSVQYVCEQLRIPYLGERMAAVGIDFSIYDGRLYRYMILARHGRGAGSTQGADLNSLIKQNVGFPADLYLGGHTHKQNICSGKVMWPNRAMDAWKSKVVVYMRGGSFLQGYPPDNSNTYAREKEYGPLPCGWGEVQIQFQRLPSESNRISIRHVKASLVSR